ncbi:lactosylceramide 1,3-N-acetyl-beta-D-glucosaminyltransferase-like, partial [Stylophora pistillata]|uniref:lactosylceramide 1,3-N-acetyl-beta-D-glucosaminyltransferase-like n=1 Tax=Stylophora pistillata TaxID=50429 RepID=UPI000C051C7B
MILKRGKNILKALAFLVAVYVSFQLRLKWSTRSSFSDIANEEVDVAEYMQWTQLQEPKINQLNSTTESSSSFTTTSIPQMKHKTFLITRRSCMQHYDLLMIISSAPGNFERRNNIRKTWAFERSAKPRWTSVFLVAQTRDEGVSNLLLEEDEALKDLVRASYYDYYYNQTHKIKMGFEWAITYCNFSFLLKLDDDVFVHIPRVLS